MELISIRQTEEPSRISEVLEAEQRLAIAIIEHAAREGEYGWLIEQGATFGFWARGVLGLSDIACLRLREAAIEMAGRKRVPMNRQARKQPPPFRALARRGKRDERAAL
jgi:hypothetical protein